MRDCRVGGVVQVLGLACALSGGVFVPTDAHAVMISEAKFVELGGNLGAVDQTFPAVLSQLRARSLSAQFLAVGMIDRCTASWLGEQGAHTYLLTAAHCVDSASGQAKTIRQTFRDWRSQVIAQGEGWAFKPPRRPGSRPGWYLSEDIAVLRLPRVATPVDARGGRLVPPTIAEDDLMVSDVIHFLGYGLTGVGSAYVPVPRAQRRVTGEALVRGLTAQGRSVVTGYEPEAGNASWAFPVSGDSGSALWRVRQGYWQMVGVSASMYWKPVFLAQAPQVSRYAAWIDGIFSGAVRQSERMTVTASMPFVSRNHVGDPSGETVHFVIPPQPGAVGPIVGRGSDVKGLSMITVAVKETRTGATDQVRLQAHRDAGCRVSPIEDAAPCPGSGNNRLNVAFRPEDNRGLKPGAYVGRFEVDVLAGSDRARRERVTLHLDIRHLLRGQVSTTAAYVSPNLAEHATHGTVYFTVPAQERARGPAAGLWNGSDIPSRILVTVRDAVSGQEREIVLRARRDPLCGGGRMTRMEDAITCQRRSAGPVTVGFHREDNPHLPAGLHRGQVTLQANDWMDRNFHQLIELDVDLDTLDAAAGAAPDQAMARASPSP